MNILIADDSQFMRQILKGLVSGAYPDATFSEANTGEDVIAKCKEAAPDLLLLDLVMTEKTGVEVLKEIGGDFSGKIIVVSAMGQEAIVDEAKSHGAAAFIVKPFEEQNVLDTIKEVLA